MQKYDIASVLCKKHKILYILFTQEFELLEFSDGVESLASTAQYLQTGKDVRESFWEFVGIEERLFELLSKKEKSFTIPVVCNHGSYYNIEVELFTSPQGDICFLCSFWKKSEIALKYFEKIQKLNQQTLKLKTDTNYANTKQSYYDLLNKQFISFHVDLEGFITQTNEMCRYFFESDSSEFFGKHFSEFFHTRDVSLKEGVEQVLYARDPLGVEVCFHTNVIPIEKEGKVVENIILCFDITYLKKIEKDLEYAVAHDSLTGVANRTRLLKKIDEAIQESKTSKKKFAICFIDLDKFKPVNDTFGHHAGDMLLKHIATLLQNFVRESDTVARIGGDEFVILFKEIESQEFLTDIIKRLELLQQKNPLHYTHEDTIHFSFSLGCSIYPDDAKDAKSLLAFADQLMYKQKKK